MFRPLLAASTLTAIAAAGLKEGQRVRAVVGIMGGIQEGERTLSGKVRIVGEKPEPIREEGRTWNVEGMPEKTVRWGGEEFPATYKISWEGLTRGERLKWNNQWFEEGQLVLANPDIPTDVLSP